jgi:hypothetical protein
MTMSYQPELIGGHLLLDLVNTVSWRLDGARRIDRLTRKETSRTGVPQSA